MTDERMRVKQPAFISASGRQHIQNTRLLEEQNHVHLYTLTRAAPEPLEERSGTPTPRTGLPAIKQNQFLDWIC